MNGYVFSAFTAALLLHATVAVGAETPVNAPAPATPSVTTSEKQPEPETKRASTEDEYITVPDTPSIDIVIHRKYLHSKKVAELYKLLGIKRTPHEIHLVDNGSITSLRDAVIPFQSRNYLAILYYLRNAVHITPNAVQQGLVEDVRYPNGAHYPLTNITKNLLTVRVSRKKPTCNVSVSVYYRNHWFYIADNDLRSKRTFSLLQQLFNLQSGDKISQTPVLTIPVG
jgi:hypothetical protein